MRRLRRWPWCVCFDGSKFAETIIADHAIYTDCGQRGLVKNVLFMCLGNVHLGIFILMVQKSCWPAGPSSQMSCRSYAKVVGLGPTDREFPTQPVTSPHKRPVTQKMFPFDDIIMMIIFCLASQYLLGAIEPGASLCLYSWISYDS